MRVSRLKARREEVDYSDYSSGSLRADSADIPLAKGKGTAESEDLAC